MQMYTGLPIMTNKTTTTEQKGIPHHLLGMIDRCQEAWHASKFKLEANRVITEIRNRGCLPIMVGGTHYYIDSLLFQERLVHFEPSETSENQVNTAEGRHPILDGPPELMLKMLKEVDPIMADRWHPNETRRIQRSLEIYLQTGRKASELYEEQRKIPVRSPNSDLGAPLLFWVHSEFEVLEQRLRTRIDKMVSRGLLTEAEDQLVELYTMEKQQNRKIDRAYGIWQSIGLKELEPYFQTLPRSPKKLDECLETMKTATRQYAKSQLRWIKSKTIPSLRRNDMMDLLFVVDSSDLSRWKETAIEPALDITAKYLTEQSLPSPSSLSSTAQKVLQENVHQKAVFCREYCDVCNRVFTIQYEWEQHKRSRGHRKVLQRKRRQALVLVDENKQERSLVVVPDPN